MRRYAKASGGCFWCKRGKCQVKVLCSWAMIGFAPANLFILVYPFPAIARTRGFACWGRRPVGESRRNSLA